MDLLADLKPQKLKIRKQTVGDRKLRISSSTGCGFSVSSLLQKHCGRHLLYSRN